MNKINVNSSRISNPASDAKGRIGVITQDSRQHKPYVGVAMNERIRELALQAGFIAVGDPEAPVLIVDNYDGIVTVELEKFAELIVRECSQFVEDKFDFCGDELIIAEQIKEHFGVE